MVSITISDSQLGSEPPSDFDRQWYKERLTKLGIDLKHTASAHRAEADRFRWIYFNLAFMPAATLSGAISIISAGWSTDEFWHRKKDSVVSLLGILVVLVASYTSFWNWQGTGERHTTSSRSFEHALTKVTQLKIHFEQRPEEVGRADFDYLKQIYTDVGRHYEDAPLLRFMARWRLARQIARDKDKQLNNIDYRD